jgi:hypothetical protein
MLTFHRLVHTLGQIGPLATRVIDLLHTLLKCRTSELIQAQ